MASPPPVKVPKPRSKNFSSEEIQILVEGLMEFKQCLFSKQSSVVTNALKHAKYLEILRRVNSVSEVTRTVEQVKKKRKDLSSSVKKKKVERKRALSRTGGCPKPKELNELEEKIVSLIGETRIEGVTGGFDSNEETTEDQDLTQAVSPSCTDTDDAVTVATEPSTEAYTLDLGKINDMPTSFDIVYPADGCSFFQPTMSMGQSGDAGSEPEETPRNKSTKRTSTVEDISMDFESQILAVEREKLKAQLEMAKTLKEILNCLKEKL